MAGGIDRFRDQEGEVRRLRTSVLLSIVCVGLSLLAVPVLADSGQNCNQNGNNQGNNNPCSPGPPTLPESHFAVLLPLIAFALLAGIIAILYLRQRVHPRIAD